MESIEYKGELFMDLKKIDDRREFLKRNLDTINTVVTAMIGVRTDLKVVEKTIRGETYFKLEPSEDDGIFYLIGDKMNNPIPDDAVDIESELDIDALEALDIDAKSTDLGDFDFTL